MAKWSGTKEKKKLIAGDYILYVEKKSDKLFYWKTTVDNGQVVAESGYDNKGYASSLLVAMNRAKKEMLNHSRQNRKKTS